MKHLITCLLALVFVTACSSVPEQATKDNRGSAERAKDSAEKAYRDLEREME
ncbi:hypothetical protein [Bermanella sp. R86510]|uniref:hypothetical protein n=1 Tax=unclassified Bermanella TaxID=2627862 RepID=UPI0037CCADBA